MNDFEFKRSRPFTNFAQRSLELYNLKSFLSETYRLLTIFHSNLLITRTGKNSQMNSNLALLNISPWVVLGQAHLDFTGGFLFLRIFSVVISVSPHVCFILDLILISMFLR